LGGEEGTPIIINKSTANIKICNPGQTTYGKTNAVQQYPINMLSSNF